MKNFTILFFLFFSVFSVSQQLTLKKGVIIDGVKVSDSVNETFAVYLPNSFEISKEWPILFVFDSKGRAKQVLSMFRESAEEQGFVLAASNRIHDSLSITKNVLVSSRMMKTVNDMIPIQQNRIYTGGYNGGARLASLIPTFIKEVSGVISCGSSIANSEVLSSKQPYHFVGIVGNENFNYPSMLNAEKVLNTLKFPNHLLVFEGGEEWPSAKYISKAMQLLTLGLMAKGDLVIKETFVQETYTNNLLEANSLIEGGKPVLAHKFLKEMIEGYRQVTNIDSLKSSYNALRKSKVYKNANRSLNSTLFREYLLKEDYAYYLEEDALTYNYKNLGWWKYQMEKLQEYEEDPNRYEKQLGRRLKGFVNALIADELDVVNSELPADEEALNFLWMLNTITDPGVYSSYLKVISFNAKNEDYGTALFYLEELLKNGYKDQESLYVLEHTALLRIMPEFNAIIDSYLKVSRYELNEQ